MIKVRYRSQAGHKFQEENFWDWKYAEAQARFEYSTCHWAQVELILLNGDDNYRDLVVLEKWGLE